MCTQDYCSKVSHAGWHKTTGIFLSCSFGDQKSEVKVLARLFSSWSLQVKELPLPLFWGLIPVAYTVLWLLVNASLQSCVFTWHYPCVYLHPLPSICVCLWVQMSPFYKNAGHNGLGLSTMTYWNLFTL